MNEEYIVVSEDGGTLHGWYDDIVSVLRACINASQEDGSVLQVFRVTPIVTFNGEATENEGTINVGELLQSFDCGAITL